MGNPSVKDISLSVDTTETFYLQAKDLFDKARSFQKDEDYSSAIPLYQQLIHLSPGAGGTAGPETISEAAKMLDEGCLQLVYCYIFAGLREDGARYLSGFYAEKENWLVRNVPRSVEIYNAYALYEATHLPEAVALIDIALARSEEGRDEELVYVDNAIASTIYNQANEVRKAIACGERSMEILRGREDKQHIVFVLGNLIYQYQRASEFDKALAAYDELIQSGEGEKNPYGLCAAELNVVDMYNEWGMLDEVYSHLKKARTAAEKSGVSEALLRVDNEEIFYALTFKNGEGVSALLDSMRVRMPDRSQTSFYHYFYDISLSSFKIRTSVGKDPAVIEEARKRLERLKGLPPDKLLFGGYMNLGYALAKKGVNDLSLQAYEACLDYVKQDDSPFSRIVVYGSLGNLYEKTGEYKKAAKYLLLAKAADSVFTENRNNRLIAQFRVKYETLEKEKANQLLRSDIQLKERTLQSYMWLGISLFLVALLFFGWLVMRQRALKLRHEADQRQHELDEVQHQESLRLIEEKEKQLRQTFMERQNLNRQNEELLGRLESMDAQNGLQEVINALSPRLLTTEEELEFRRQFGVLYPSFLLKLREACPAITRGEELLSMLLRLNLTSEEIALALGNNRTSVNTARFRLRKKLELEKDVTLEDFLRKL